MIDQGTERVFFLSLVFAITIAFFWLIHDFLQPIFWAIALGIVVYPLHVWLARRLAAYVSSGYMYRAVRQLGLPR